MKKFEEGVFSDLRNLKPGVDACLEEPKVRLRLSSPPPLPRMIRARRSPAGGDGDGELGYIASRIGLHQRCNCLQSPD